MSYSYSAAIIITIIIFIALHQRPLVAQGTVQVDSGQASNTIDLSSGTTIIFANATSPGDAATAVINSNMSWVGSVTFNSAGRFRTVNNSFTLNGAIFGTGDMILAGGAGSLFRVQGDLSGFNGNIILPEQFYTIFYSVLVFFSIIIRRLCNDCDFSGSSI